MFVRHGESVKRPPEYKAWQAMNERCYSRSNKQYKDYGERGVRVCARWRGPDGYQNFLADMGRRPSPRYSLDRKDNDGNYEPANCRWATRVEQQRNRRTNRLLTFQGKTQTAVEWAEELGINANTLRARLFAGWSTERALKA